MARRFVDATHDCRCKRTIALRDKSKAQCGRRATFAELCTQHRQMDAAWSCVFCGGNDESPPDHCVDCTRLVPTTTERLDP